LGILAATKSMRQADDLLRYIESDTKLVANRVTYNTLLRAYSFQKGSGKKAEGLLQRWENQVRLGKVKQIPNANSYSVVISCWSNAKVKNAAANAEEILIRMERNNVPANLVVYNMVLAAWSRSQNPEAEVRAQAIWDRMNERNEDSYISMINVYVREHDKESLDKAKTLLKKGYASGEFKPGTRICSSILSGYAALGDSEAGRRCDDLLNWMDSVGIRPDTKCYNSAIRAHKNSQIPMSGCRAMDLYERMLRSHLRPTCATYTLLIEACKDDVGIVIDLFQDCVEEGMLDGVLAETFRQVGPPIVVDELRGGVPHEWRRNAGRGPRGKQMNGIRK